MLAHQQFQAGIYGKEEGGADETTNDITPDDQSKVVATTSGNWSSR